MVRQIVEGNHAIWRQVNIRHLTSQRIALNESEPVMPDDIDRQLSSATTGPDSFKVLCIYYDSSHPWCKSEYNALPLASLSGSNNGKELYPWARKCQQHSNYFRGYDHLHQGDRPSGTSDSNGCGLPEARHLDVVNLPIGIAGVWGDNINDRSGKVYTIKIHTNFILCNGPEVWSTDVLGSVQCVEVATWEFWWDTIVFHLSFFRNATPWPSSDG